jgi:TolB-like protein
LASVLWSDRSDKQARDSLRQALTELRRSLEAAGPLPLVIERDLVSLDRPAIGSDVDAFELLSGRTSPDDLRKAASLYGGELLEGIDVHDPAFTEWLSFERQRLSALAVGVLKRLVASESGAEAVLAAQRLLALDPLQEAGHHALMRIHAEAGDTSSALRQYEIYCETMKRELDVGPSPDMTALLREVRAGDRKTLPRRASSTVSPTSLPSSKESGMSTPALRPAIAVLPFVNLSGDASQQYFSDGITEDIITELSRFRSLFVIARNSSFQFRDKATDVRRIAQELSVQFVVEGSVRRNGDRLRITAQLIDAATGSNLWADRYDRSLDDLFAVQDEVVYTIAGTLEGRLVTRVAEQARSRPTHSMAAYECVLQAREYLSTFETEAAEPLLRRAIELDPNYAQARGWLGIVYLDKYFFDPRPELLDQALLEGQRAVALDESDARCHSTLGSVYLFRREFERAGLHHERARTLNANDVTICAAHAHWLCRVGRVSEALAAFDRALQRDPFPPGYYWETRSVALILARRFQEAIDAIRRMKRLFSWSHADLAACHAHLGQMDEARAEAAEALRMQPHLTVSWLLQEEPFKYPADAEPLIEGMRMAGIPE